MGTKKIKLLSYVLGGILCLLLVWQLVLYFQHRGLTGVTVLAVPSDSTLKVDGQPTGLGKIYLTSGGHKIVASRQYFDDDVKVISTADVIKGQIIYMLPSANSAAAKSYLAAHPNIQKLREAAGGAESDRIRAVLLKRYPIIAKLPQETLHYKIDYSIDKNQNLSLTVTTYGVINGPADYDQYVQQTKAYKQEALDFLKQNGIGPTTFHTAYIPNL